MNPKVFPNKKKFLEKLKIKANKRSLTLKLIKNLFDFVLNCPHCWPMIHKSLSRGLKLLKVKSTMIFGICNKPAKVKRQFLICANRKKK